MTTFLRLPLAACLTTLFLTLADAEGATRTWTGASVTMNGVPQDNFWTNPFNWSGNVAPVAGDDLVFDGGSQLSSINDFSTGTTFNSLAVRGHSMEGAGIALNAGLSATASQINFSSVKLAEIKLASIKLNNAQTFTALFSPFTFGVTAIINSSIDNNGKALSLDGQGYLSLQGVISGTGGLIKGDFATVQLLADNSYTGVTTVNKGELLVFGSQAGSSVQVSTLTPQNGQEPTLGGGGTVGAVSFTLGGVISPGDLNQGTGILKVSGNLSYPANSFSQLNIDLKGTNPGTGYDQVRTAGEVNLGKLTVLNVSLSGFAPAVRQTFTIIQNDSATPVQGIFNGYPEGTYFTVNSTPFVISYKGGDGNDVVLRVPAVWNGGGNDDNWTTAANWRGDVLPIPGDILVFPAFAKRSTNVNNFPDGTAFAGMIVEDVYRMSGNGVVLGALGLSAGYLWDAMPLAFGEPSLIQNVNSNVFITGPVNLGPHTLTVKALTCESHFPDRSPAPARFKNLAVSMDGWTLKQARRPPATPSKYSTAIS